MERKKGHLLLEDYQILEKKKVGELDTIRLLHAENKYYVKEMHGIKKYRELFYPILLKNIKVATVENDLVIINGKKE